eukprot:Gregarina_sp_Poly_1__6048@NODE_3191_length_1289_cov_25_397709_g2026_i0_p2_GENE_NODE_3191_length_1289_cov_25_397709_g2026_i0NODE_3191_length_1289_cov_25_397709_g2026_i0_p2_ORF_typecomplete_len134_score19_11BDHCT_assoc/PF16204_5/0_013Pox_I3/PF04661_12/0_034DUF4611/PF15387_6/0_045_NODE_3191_length_1289_cov_25_397709_g2026_i0138539
MSSKIYLLSASWCTVLIISFRLSYNCNSCFEISFSNEACSLSICASTAVKNFSGSVAAMSVSRAEHNSARTSNLGNKLDDGDSDDDDDDDEWKNPLLIAKGGPSSRERAQNRAANSLTFASWPNLEFIITSAQ